MAETKKEGSYRESMIFFPVLVLFIIENKSTITI